MDGQAILAVELNRGLETETWEDDSDYSDGYGDYGDYFDADEAETPEGGAVH